MPHSPFDGSARVNFEEVNSGAANFSRRAHRGSDAHSRGRSGAIPSRGAAPRWPASRPNPHPSAQLIPQVNGWKNREALRLEPLAAEGDIVGAKCVAQAEPRRCIEAGR